MITAEELKNCLKYDSETGDFVWLVKKNGVKKNMHAGSLNRGYTLISINGQRYFAHRLAWIYVYGEWPCGEIDHIDGDRSNNRIENLRIVDRSQNMQNEGHARSSNSVGSLGVSRHGSKYRARIEVNGKQTHIGTFDTVIEASVAYLKAKKMLHGAAMRCFKEVPA